MKFTFWSLLILLVAVACTPSGSQAITIDPTADARQLRQLKEVHWPTAYREQDTMLLDQILDGSFQMVDAGGNWSDKAGEMDWIKAHAMEHDSFFYTIKRLDILENGTAIVAGTGHMINKGVEMIYESSNVLIKRGDRWKAIASHVSGIRAPGSTAGESEPGK
ncbi:nuclear transport factor 2 family protein [Flavilitoribacter nigricans]|uniref:DUF4440 domain-containing protein n=1 Tax=Flavilitoribacter nigricans (strain ATCC 23147 / DSM 23189 / NBRC 102662 / NCIMB 1420 / SS-2) TaxID=1122177 RepID=A0A2D0N6J6_FLAN2|nr:nuclear transport factor 2 family protein [Flavilitoribacter nigricans]PHN04115.1 hypothetical protein CRP01_23245 [Flavilitoribacter nigricans DSM 23189 = NBRC 102662]